MLLKKLIVIFAFVGAMFPLFPLRARTITVANDGSGEYFSIQAAVEAAERGDTLFVKAGTYYESDIRLDKEISLKGEGPDVTEIIGRIEQSKESEPFILSLSGWFNVQVEGFYLSWEGYRPGDGVIIESAFARLSKCKIMNCHVGVDLYTDADWPNNQIISGNTITDNEYGVVWSIISIPYVWPDDPLYLCEASHNWWGVTSEAEIRNSILLYEESQLRNWGVYDECVNMFLQSLKPWLTEPVEIENFNKEVEEGIHYNNIYGNDVNLVLPGVAELSPVTPTTWGEIKEFFSRINRDGK